MPPSDSRYAIVAEKPASSSNGAVPGSNLPSDRIGSRGPRLVRPPRLEQLVPAVCEPEVRAAELVRRAEEARRNRAPARRRARARRTAPRRSSTTRRPSARARRHAPRRRSSRSHSTTRHTTTTRTRSSSFRSRSSRSSRRSSVTSIQSTTKPRSSASSTHGATPPSWSRRDTRIRSPSFQSRDAVRESAKSSTVMFVAEDHVVGRAVRGTAPASLARLREDRLDAMARSRTARRCSPAPSRSARAIASPTSSGTCEPPGASRKTKSPCSDVNRRRSACTSSSVVAHGASLPRRHRAPRLPDHPRLRQLRRHRLGARVLREGRDARRGVRDHGRRLGGRHHDLRHRRRLRRGPQRGDDRRMAPLGAGVPTASSSRRRRSTRWTEGADHGLAPARVQRQLESSLQRLGVERVDLFLTHDWDPDVPIAETAGTLEELKAEGKIGAYGLSNVDGPHLREALGRRPLRLGPELVLAARPRGRGATCSRSALRTVSASLPSALSPAAGSRASTAAAHRRPPDRG